MTRMRCSEYVDESKCWLFVARRVQLLTSNVTCESWYVIQTLLLPGPRALAGSLIPQAAMFNPTVVIDPRTVAAAV